MARRRRSGVNQAGDFLTGFNEGYRTTGAILSDMETARIARESPDEQTTIVEASKPDPNDYTYDSDTGQYVPSLKAVQEGRSAGLEPKQAQQTGKTETKYLGKTYEGKLSDEDRDFAKTNAIADANIRYGRVQEGLALKNSARQGRLADVDYRRKMEEDRGDKIINSGSSEAEVIAHLKAAGMNARAEKYELERRQAENQRGLLTVQAAKLPGELEKAVLEGKISGQEAQAKLLYTFGTALETGNHGAAVSMLNDPATQKAYGGGGEPRTFTGIQKNEDGTFTALDKSGQALRLDPEVMKSWHSKLAGKSDLVKMGADDVLYDPKSRQVVAQGPGRDKWVFGGSGETGLFKMDSRSGNAYPVAGGSGGSGGSGGKGAKDKDVLAARDKLKGEVRAALGLGTTQFDKLSDDEKGSVQAQYAAAAKSIDDDKNLEHVLRGKTDMFLSPARDKVKREAATSRVRGQQPASASGVDWNQFGVR